MATGAIAVIPKYQFSSATGTPLVNGTLTTYLALTTTPVATYQDAGLTTPNSNPILLDSRGECVLWLDASKKYKFLLKDASGAPQWTEDNISGAPNIFDPSITFSSLQITYTQGGSGSITRTVQAALRDWIKTSDFGFIGDGSLADKARFQSAVNATPIGGTLLVPSTGSDLLLYTADGLSGAVLINKRMTLRIEGALKATYGTMQLNPPYMFKVTSNDVSFCGGGKLIGNGTKDDTNAGDETNMPGLVYVTGSNFSFTGLTLDTPPKLGILLYSCAGARITGNTFTGGPTTYTVGNTAYFAIRAFNGGKHVISNNTFTPDGSNGMYLSCIFFNGAEDCVINGNTAVNPYEKLAYLYGNKNIVSNNVVVGNQNSIPGTAQKGTLTSVYRVNGNYNKIINNISDFCLAGATVMDGNFNEVSGNTFAGCGQTGVAVFGNTFYVAGFDNTVIKNNTITAGAMTGVTLQDGVVLNLDKAESYYLDISGNSISGFADSAAEAQIRVIAVAPYAIRHSHISSNTISGGTNGIITDRVTDSLIEGNYVRSTSTQGMTETGGAFNRWVNNKCNSAQIGISGLNAASEGFGNQYTNANLTGRAVLAVAITTTVTHGGVAANARIFIQEANQDAGTMLTAKGRCYTGISTNDFVITVANGTAAGGTERFDYHIVQ